VTKKDNLLAPSKLLKTMTAEIVLVPRHSGYHLLLPM
jgi:hypothetical protein